MTARAGECTQKCDDARLLGDAEVVDAYSSILELVPVITHMDEYWEICNECAPYPWSGRAKLA